MDANSSLLVSQITLGAVAAWGLEKLKGASWFPLLHEESAKAIKILAAVVTSICAITGLSYVWDPVAHTILIQNVSLASIGAASWHWLTQFVMQEGWYQGIIQKAQAQK